MTMPTKARTSTTPDSKPTPAPTPLTVAPVDPPPELPIHRAMAAILGELPAIGKNQRNEQQQFNFRGIDDVLNSLNPLLTKYGVFYVPHVIERLGETRTTKNGGTMHAVHLHVRFTFYGPMGDHIDADTWGEGTDSGDKATPKAMTGAMKYCLFQVFAISTQEASETDADRSTPDDTMRLHCKTCTEGGADFVTVDQDELRQHMVDEHGWTRGDDGRVQPPTKPESTPPAEPDPAPTDPTPPPSPPTPPATPEPASPAPSAPTTPPAPPTPPTSTDGLDRPLMDEADGPAMVQELKGNVAALKGAGARAYGKLRRSAGITDLDGITIGQYNLILDLFETLPE